MTRRFFGRHFALSFSAAFIIVTITGACASKAPISVAKPSPAQVPLIPPPPKVEARSIVSARTPAEKIYSKAKEAVVKVVVRKDGQPFAFGAGFFISADGRLITNRHVVKEAITANGLAIEFQLADGKTTVRRYAIGGCGDERELDLCVLKLDHKPKQWIDATPVQVKPGERSYVIGHPEGFEYTFSDGIISAVRELEYNVKYVQFTASISQGNSGGPVLDERGRLLGIATKFSVEGQNLNFAIATSEIDAYVRKHSKFVPLAAYLQAEVSQIIARLGGNPMSKWIPPTDPRANDGRKAPMKFGDPVTYQFPVEGDTVFLPAPNGLFEDCAPIQNGLNRAAACRDKRTRSTMVVATLPLRQNSILARNGQLPETPNVHDFDPKAPNAQPGASLPLPWGCRKAKEFHTTRLAGRGEGACFAMIKNAGRSGAFKLLAEVESLGRIYGFMFTSEEPRLINYAQAWLQFAVSNAVSTGMAQVSQESRAPASLGRASWPFQVDLPSKYREFEFVRSRTGGVYLAKAVRPPFAIAITPLRPGIQPGERRQFRDRMVKTETQPVVGAPDLPRIETATAVVKDLEGTPGFVIAGRGQGVARDRVIFQGAIHVDGTTFIVSGAAPWQDRSEASKEFTRLLRTLRPVSKN